MNTLNLARTKDLAQALGLPVGSRSKAQLQADIRSADLNGLNNAQLKAALAILGKSQGGKKADLTARLQTAIGTAKEGLGWGWILLIAVVALALVILAISGGRLAHKIWDNAQTPQVTEEAPAVVAPPAKDVPEETPVVAEAISDPVVVDTVVVAPVLSLTESFTHTKVFTYTPGGEGFGQWATDVITPDGATQPCGRIWQATNLENLAWTTIFCDWQVSEPAPKLQWPHATQLTVSGWGIVEFELWRDLAASATLDTDPYGVANAKNSPLGLGWMVQGFNGTVCINDVCQKLEGGGVYQLGFPQDMKGGYRIRIVIDNGQVNFWQGERLTSVDNWPLPSAPTP